MAAETKVGSRYASKGAYSVQAKRAAVGPALTLESLAAEFAEMREENRALKAHNAMLVTRIEQDELAQGTKGSGSQARVTLSCRHAVEQATAVREIAKAEGVTITAVVDRAIQAEIERWTREQKRR
jgi:hypothetical protein